MAIDIIARGLAASLVGADGKLSSDKRPVVSGTSDLSGFTSIGKLTDPTAIEGKTAEEILLMMLYGVVSPTLTAPSLSVALLTDDVVIVDKPAQIEGTLTFDRGSISPAYGTSGFRAGFPTSYIVNGVEEASAATSYSFSFLYTPTVGMNEIECVVKYAEGEQPLNSAGVAYDSPLSAGQVTTGIVLRGVYQFYDGEGNEKSFEFIEDEDGFGYLSVFASEGTGTKQSFCVTQEVTVTGIKQFDTMTQQWSWIGGSPEASLLTFDTEPLLVDGKEYVRYVHNGSNRGERSLRVYVAYE